MGKVITESDVVLLQKGDFTTQDSVAGALSILGRLQVPQGVEYVVHPGCRFQLRCHDGTNNIVIGTAEVRRQNATRKKHDTPIGSDLALMQGNVYNKNEAQHSLKDYTFLAGQWLDIWVNAATAILHANAGTTINLEVIQRSVNYT